MFQTGFLFPSAYPQKKKSEEHPMSKVKITCDSTCDLTKALYEQHQIGVVPLGISLGEDLHYDGQNITADELFRYVEESGHLPTTSAISIGEYLDVFRGYVEDGYQVVHINLSSELSSSHQNAVLAAEELGNVFVVDSRSLSTGSGLLVLLAGELAAKGMSAADIAAALNEKKELLDVSFVLQTLEYLRKGGRCSAIAAFGANALKLRPEIQVENGTMKPNKKYRGDAERTILQYIRGHLEGRTDIDTDRIFITHSGVPQEILDKATALVAELHPFREIIVTRAGCTISSHCGPLCLGVLFFRTEQ
jgi:DegV family protein with EDD domain